MQQRHLTTSNMTLTVIDNNLARGRRQDWIDLRHDVLNYSAVAGKVVRVCMAHLPGTYTQRYHYWMLYVNKHSI